MEQNENDLNEIESDDESYDDEDPLFPPDESSKQSSKNWLPDDIVKPREEPVAYITSIHETPQVLPLKLATLTVNAEIPVHFNLKVIGLYLPLDDHIIGVKCEGVAQRGWFKQKLRKKKKVNKGRKDKNDFYNQCTINVKPYGIDNEELINMKIFSNGKIGLTGVKKIKDVSTAIEYVVKQIDKVQGHVIYNINNIEKSDPKNFRKKLIDKIKLLKYISERHNKQIDWDQFIEGINVKGKCGTTSIALSDDIGYVLTLIEILEYKTAINHMMEEDFNKYDTIIDEIKNTFQDRTQIHNQQELDILASYYSNISKVSYQNLSDLILDTVDENKDTCKDKDVDTGKDKYIEANTDIDISPILRYKFQADAQMNLEKFILNYCQALSNSAKDELRTKYDNLSTMSAPTYEYVKLAHHLTNSPTSDIKDCVLPHFTIKLPAWIKPEAPSNANTSLVDFYGPNCITISNINTTFSINFELCRTKFHNILINKYGVSDCSLEPNYGGINLKYLSMAECNIHDTKDSNIKPEYNGCECKLISILIFSNSTLITGGRTYRQTLESYEYIKEIIIKEFPNILKANVDNKLDKCPNIVQTADHTYLKKAIITKNPKNHFILGKLGLLDKYLHVQV